MLSNHDFTIYLNVFFKRTDSAIGFLLKQILSLGKAHKVNPLNFRALLS